MDGQREEGEGSLKVKVAMKKGQKVCDGIFSDA